MVKFILPFAALCLSGCGESAPPPEPQMMIWSDPKTRCKYIYRQSGIGMVAMSIRFRADGTADCPKARVAQGEQ